MRFPHIISLIGLAALCGCGTILGDQTQEITLLTPGAYDAECTLDNGNIYKMRTGDTRRVQRTYKPLTVDCYATGNRHLIKYVGSGINEYTYANISNGIIPGVAYDAASNGLYDYPKVINVDFSGVPNTGFDLPAYHDKDNPSPYNQAIEDYGPRTPRIPNDSTYLKRGVERRGADMNTNPFSTPGSTLPSPVMSPAPGDPADALTRSMNPGVFGN